MLGSDVERGFHLPVAMKPDREATGLVSDARRQRVSGVNASVCRAACG